jgi:uncharacterized protein YciI
MEKRFFLYRLLPPRPTFHLDLNEKEKEVMQRHGRYWAELTKQRIAIVYGPVFDPKGVFGVAIMEVDTEDQGLTIVKADPAVASRTCTYELIPMKVGTIRS